MFYLLCGLNVLCAGAILMRAPDAGMATLAGINIGLALLMLVMGLVETWTKRR